MIIPFVIFGYKRTEWCGFKSWAHQLLAELLQSGHLTSLNIASFISWEMIPVLVWFLRVDPAIRIWKWAILCSRQRKKKEKKSDRNQLNTCKWAHVPSPTGGALGNAIKTASDASCGASRQGQAICLLCFPLANSSLVVLIISTSISTYEQKRRLL